MHRIGHIVTSKDAMFTRNDMRPGCLTIESANGCSAEVHFAGGHYGKERAVQVDIRTEHGSLMDTGYYSADSFVELLARASQINSLTIPQEVHVVTPDDSPTERGHKVMALYQAMFSVKLNPRNVAEQVLFDLGSVKGEDLK